MSNRHNQSIMIRLASIIIWFLELLIAKFFSIMCQGLTIDQPITHFEDIHA